MPPLDPTAVARILDEAIAAATSWGVPHLELVLLRHGQPLPAAQRQGGQALDPPLSGLGRRQVEAAVAYLARVPVDAVYSSTLARAVDTAQIVSQAYGLHGRILAGLREIGLFPEVDPPGKVPGLAAWLRAAAEFRRCGRWESLLPAESGPGFRSRVREAIDDITGRHSSGRVVVACHSGVINAHLSDVLGLDRDYAVRPAHASITRTWLSAGKWTLCSLNETGHLGEELYSA